MKALPISKLAKVLLYGVLFYLIITFVLYPLLNLLQNSLQASEGYSFANYLALIQSNADRMALLNTLKIGVLSTLCCMVVGVYLAFQTEFFRHGFSSPWVKNMLMFPFILPGVIIVIANIQIFGELGIFPQLLKQLFGLDNVPFALKGFWGIIFVHTFTQYIYFYLNTSIALRFFDFNQIEGAKNLGASNFRIFIDILLPHLKPALITSALITFSTAISSFSAPYLVGGGYRTMSIQVLQYKMSNMMSLASAVVVSLMLITFVTIFMYQHYQKNVIKSSKSKAYSQKKIQVSHPLLRKLQQLLVVVILLMIFLPMLGILYMSFVDTRALMMNSLPTDYTINNYINVLNNRRILAPIKNSITMSAIAAITCTLLAAISSYLILNKNTWINRLMGFFVLLPVAIPASTLGVTLILAFNKKTPLLFGNSLVGTYWILPIAYVIGSIAIVSRSTFTAFLGFNKEYEYSSKSLGATSAQTMLYVFLPIVKSGIISGFILCFMRSLGEYTVSALLYGALNKPISIAMVNALHDFDIGVSMVYGVMVMSLGLILFLVMDVQKIQS